MNAAPGRSLGDTAAAVLLCALVQLGFETAVALARGSALDAAYLGGLALFSTTAAVAVGVAAGLRGDARAALALWVALDGTVRFPLGPALGSAALAASFALVYGALSVARRGERGGLALAWLLAPARAVAVVLGPALAARLGLGELGSAICALAVTAVLVLGLGAWRPRAGLRAPVPALLLLVALVAFVEATSRSLRAERRPAEYPAPRAAGSPNVLLLVLDTVRADELSIYGSSRDTTPELASFLERSPSARLYPLAFAPSNWTIPSHVSLLTSRMPSEHGLHYGARGDLRESATSSWSFSGPPSLGEVFHRAGYRTGAVLANPHLLRVRGLERGFDLWIKPQGTRIIAGVGDALRRLILPGRFAYVGRYAPRADSVHREALRFLDGCEEGGCFLLLNYMEAHTPWAPDPPHAGRFTGDADRGGPGAVSIGDPPETLERGRLRYAEEIHSLDAALGKLLRGLEENGLLARSWLVITSDHGESFGEHGVVYHGSSIYNEQVRIPLLIRPPDGASVAPATTAVDLLDVSRTLAGIVGHAPGGAGRDLRRRLTPRPIRIEFYGRDLPGDRERHGPLAAEPARAVVLDGRKLIAHLDRLELYDLERDPGERHDLAAREPGRARDLERRLRALRPGPTAPPTSAPASAEEREALRELGYLP